jgi:hypothetical protein
MMIAVEVGLCAGSSGSALRRRGLGVYHDVLILAIDRAGRIKCWW